LFADHQGDGHGPLVVRGPQVENRWFIQYTSNIVYNLIFYLSSMKIAIPIIIPQPSL